LDTETLRHGFALKRFISLGDEFKERDEPDKAIVAYQNATKLNGDDSTIWRILGNLYSDTERYAEAIIAYNSAINAGLPQSSIASGLGVALLSNQDYDGAIEKFKLATTKKPSESWLWSLRGDAHLAKGDINAAINMFKKATKRKPVALLTYEKLGKAYCMKGDIDKAMNWYTLALKYHSSSPTLQGAIIELIAVHKATESQDSDPIRSGAVPTPITRNRDSGQDSNTSSLISSMSGSLLTILRLAERARLLPSTTSDSIETKSTESDPTQLSSVATSFDEFYQIEEDLESTCDIYSGETISKGTHLVGLWRHAPQCEDEMSVYSGDIVVVEKIYQDGSALGYKSSSTVWTIDMLPDNAEPRTKKRSTILKTPWGKRQDNAKEPVSLRFPLDIFCHGKVWKNVYTL
jgi:tetratricopeptide (TPR) repeat protein